MRRYSVAQVEMLTGIKAHTLRIWERRYSIIKPERTETNIRYYSDEQLRQLLNINILLRNGYRISKLDAMADDQIHTLVAEIIDSSSDVNKDDIDALKLAMVEFNEKKFNAVFNKHVIRHGLQKAMVDLIYPFLNHVGMLWATNQSNPAQEHFISNLVRQKLIAAIDALPLTDEDNPALLLFLVDGEYHELGLLLTYYIAKGMGFQVHYLGQNVPIDDIPMMVDQVNPSILISFFTSPLPDSLKEYIKDIIIETGLPILFSGIRVNSPIPFDYEKATFVNSPQSLIDYLEKVK